MAYTSVKFFEDKNKDELKEQIETFLDDESPAEKKIVKIDYQVIYTDGYTVSGDNRIPNVLWTAMLVWEYID